MKRDKSLGRPPDILLERRSISMKAFISAFDKRDDGMVPLRLLDCNLKYVNDAEEKSGSPVNPPPP